MTLKRAQTEVPEACSPNVLRERIDAFQSIDLMRVSKPAEAANAIETTETLGPKSREGHVRSAE